MLVVPIAKDVIQTVDGAKYRVIEYTNYKDGGPAVYAKSLESKEVVLVYFFDIISINKTQVEYQKSSRIFHALGKIHRKQYLPQPDDMVKIAAHHNDKSQENITIEVVSLKLKSKSLGINKGMFVKCDDGNYYRLKQIIDISRSLGGHDFDRSSFLEYYKDYTGV